MRLLISLLILSSICSAANADIKFGDVPADHWAAPAVYDLVKQGVTSGYPDGTFRGDKNLTRYETAALLSKLSEKSTEKARTEKILAELKTELNTAKYQLDHPEGFKLSGNYTDRIRAQYEDRAFHGPLIDHRLKVSLLKEFNYTDTLKINLDTLYTDPAQIDFEGRTRGLSVSFGAGDILHRDPISYSDDGTVFRMKYPRLSTSTRWNNLDLDLAYTVLANTLSGEATLSETSLSVSYRLGKFRFSARPSLLGFINEHDARGEIAAGYDHSKEVSAELLFGVGNLSSYHSQYVRGKFKIDLPDTDLAITIHKVGSAYRPAYARFKLLELNQFDKYVLDGTVDAGFILTQLLFPRIRTQIRSDVVANGDLTFGEAYPGTTLTSEFGLSYDLTDNISGYGFYRNYQVPSGVSSKDSALAISVPKSSGLFGAKIGIVF
ncbi:S-layer homology domain-containing protein [Candidatus Saganbacteria bacterium]|nr:S-layer homology domain-containing protein [Candidatus Saganbacteria bacterium]